MKSDRRLLGAALGFALVVSACSSAASSPAASAAASSAASAAPSAAASAAPSEAASQDNGGGAPTDNPAGASGLEKWIPAKVGDATMQISSFDYSKIGLSGLALAQADVDDYLKSKGKTIADISFAMGVSSTGKPMMYVFQLKGVPATDFAPNFFKTELNGMDKKNIGGKDVYWTGAANYTTAIYLHDDVMVYILLASEDEAAQILSSEP